MRFNQTIPLLYVTAVPVSHFFPGLFLGSVKHQLGFWVTAHEALNSFAFSRKTIRQTHWHLSFYSRNGSKMTKSSKQLQEHSGETEETVYWETGRAIDLNIKSLLKSQADNSYVWSLNLQYGCLISVARFFFFIIYLFLSPPLYSIPVNSQNPIFWSPKLLLTVGFLTLLHELSVTSKADHYSRRSILQ
jgi:hypothetical protein